MVRAALGAIRSPAASTALRTSGSLALTAADAVETVTVLADREASWQEKAVAGAAVLPLGTLVSKAGKTSLRVVDNLSDSAYWF